MSDFYLLVAGSRDFGGTNSRVISGEIVSDFDIMTIILDALLKNWIDSGYTIHIVEGDARGTDRMAGRYADMRGYQCHKFPADWNKYGKRAGMVRNAEMYGFIAGFEHRAAQLFWDGESRGTRDNFLRAGNTGVTLSCYNFITGNFLSQEEIDSVYEDVLEERRKYS